MNTINTYVVCTINKIINEKNHRVEIKINVTFSSIKYKKCLNRTTHISLIICGLK